jgi:hypothetical protein
MIALAADCLVFQMAGGESIPFCSDMISVELMGDTTKWLDQEFVRQAAKAVFHYFQHEMGRKTITIGEFAGAMEKVLSGFNLKEPPRAPEPKHRVQESDLSRLADESGLGCELFFFPRLRDELRRLLREGPNVLRFRGLRGCVKQLVGTRRWTGRCQTLQDQIVSYLRQCLNTEPKPAQFALVVE